MRLWILGIVSARLAWTSIFLPAWPHVEQFATSRLLLILIGTPQRPLVKHRDSVVWGTLAQESPRSYLCSRRNSWHLLSESCLPGDLFVIRYDAYSDISQDSLAVVIIFCFIAIAGCFAVQRIIRFTSQVKQMNTSAMLFRHFKWGGNGAH